MSLWNSINKGRSRFYRLSKKLLWRKTEEKFVNRVMHLVCVSVVSIGYVKLFSTDRYRRQALMNKVLWTSFFASFDIFMRSHLLYQDDNTSRSVFVNDPHFLS